MKLTKSQIKLIAKIHMASSIWNSTGADAFYGTDTSDDEQDLIANMQRDMAYKILGGHPILHTSQEVLDYVRTITRKK